MRASEYWLTTERLALRHFTADDLDWLAALYADADVTRYLGGLRDRAGAEQLLNVRILQYYRENPGLGIWMTVEQATGERVGYHLLNHIQGETIIQIGYGLAKSAWGKGFGTEMAAAVLRYGFADLKLPRVAGITHVDNLASQRVLLKIGLHRHGTRFFPHPAYASSGPMAFFEREAPDWLAERSEPQRGRNGGPGVTTGAG